MFVMRRFRIPAVLMALVVLVTATGCKISPYHRNRAAPATTTIQANPATDAALKDCIEKLARNINAPANNPAHAPEQQTLGGSEATDRADEIMNSGLYRLETIGEAGWNRAFDGAGELTCAQQLYARAKIVGGSSDTAQLARSAVKTCAKLLDDIVRSDQSLGTYLGVQDPTGAACVAVIEINNLNAARQSSGQDEHFTCRLDSLRQRYMVKVRASKDTSPGLYGTPSTSTIAYNVDVRGAMVGADERPQLEAEYQQTPLC